MSDDTTDLYRYFDADGKLLYVGISLSALNRAIQHKSSAGWWSQQRTMTRETHPTRSAAEEAERRAIATEKPIHNIVHNRHRAEVAPPRLIAPTNNRLIGKFFLTPDEVEGFPLAKWQGWVLDELASGTYLIELFSWRTGCPNGQQVASVAEMGDWRFYADENHFLEWADRAAWSRGQYVKGLTPHVVARSSFFPEPADRSWATE